MNDSVRALKIDVPRAPDAQVDDRGNPQQALQWMQRHARLVDFDEDAGMVRLWFGNGQQVVTAATLDDALQEAMGIPAVERDRSARATARQIQGELEKVKATAATLRSLLEQARAHVRAEMQRREVFRQYHESAWRFNEVASLSAAIEEALKAAES